MALGVNVIGVSRSAGPLNELKDELKGKTFEGIQLDLSHWKKTRETLGSLKVKLDGVVNNAGIAIMKDFDDLTEDDYDQVMGVNLKGELSFSAVFASLFIELVVFQDASTFCSLCHRSSRKVRRLLMSHRWPLLMGSRDTPFTPLRKPASML